MTDEDWMQVALEEAQLAPEHGDIPVGAVLVSESGIELCRARNRREIDADPTAHAEILALRSAAEKQGHWRLEGASLYVTLEPCPMCAGALVNARVRRVVYGAHDPKAGAVETLYRITQDSRLNHRVEVVSGVLADSARTKLQDFSKPCAPEVKNRPGSAHVQPPESEVMTQRHEPMIPIPISDFSIANALGTSRGVFCERLFANESGLCRAQSPLTTELGRIETLPALPSELGIYDSRVARIAWLGLEPLALPIKSAIARFGAARVGVVVGSSTGGVESSERAVAFYRERGRLPNDYSFDNGHAFDALTRMTRQAFGIEGPAYVISTACSSSAKALATAQRLIATGLLDAAIAGGADSLCGLTLYGFQSLGVLSKTRCQPFGEGRSGINLGEGSAFVLLERAASSSLYLLGAGESSDAHHLSSPHPRGAGAKLAMERALAAAGMTPSQIDYLNAHGTGTDLNDSAEALAIEAVFTDRLPVSSTKAATGHLLGAAGATEAIVCLLALEQGKLPPNLTTRVDPALNLDIVSRTRPSSLRTALSNSLAFGGSNSSLLFGRLEPNELPGHAPTEQPKTGSIEIVAAATWPPQGRSTNTPASPPATLLPARARGRASSLSRLFAEVVGTTQQQAFTPAASLPIVYGSSAGEMETTLELLEQLRAEGSSPARFQASVHNTAGGLISIATHNQAFSTAVAAGTETVAMAFIEAMAWLGAHGGEIVVAAADEAAPTLLNGKTYPAGAAAFLLRHVGHGGQKTASMSIGLPRRVSSDVGIHSGLNENPCAPALALAHRIMTRTAGSVPLTGKAGVQWVVDLEAQ